MNPNGGGDPSSRCPKHPSQAPFTGFCSACLLERLSAATQIPSPSSSFPAAPSQPRPRPTRTTLLYLFQLDDMANGSVAADHLPLQQQQQQDPPQSPPQQAQAQAAAEDPPLQRKRSLRHSCDWIVCCDTANDSCLPSRQSWDGSAAAAAAPPPTAALVLDRRRNKASLTWPFRGFVNKPAHILKRSLSESWRYGRQEEDTRRQPDKSSAAGIRSNGTHSVSSAGMDSEISLPDADAHNVRRHSLMRRLYWLGRSRSVHYSSPTTLDTQMLRFHLTPLRRSVPINTQGRRLNLFTIQRYQQ